MSPLYRGGGTGLLYRVMAHSYSLGFGGRVNLCALPVPNTEEFYQRLGFLPAGMNPEDMMIYEIRPGQAVKNLINAGWLS